MAAYLRVYDSRHLQADYQEPGSSPEPRSVIECGLPFLQSLIPELCEKLLQVSAVANRPARLSCCRQSLTITCDKLQRSTLGARSYCQLSWPTTVQFITLWVSTVLDLSWQHASTIDMIWRNFQSPEFEAKFQREVHLFLKVPEFP